MSRIKKVTVRFALSVLLLAFTVSAQAQQVKRIRKIGFLAAASPWIVSDRMTAFQLGLRELRYIDGKNIVIESRYAEGKLDRLPTLLAELMQLKIEILVSGGPIPTIKSICTAFDDLKKLRKLKT